MASTNLPSLSSTVPDEPDRCPFCSAAHGHQLGPPPFPGAIVRLRTLLWVVALIAGSLVIIDLIVILLLSWTRR